MGVTVERRVFSVGDRLTSVYARLRRPDGSPVTLSATGGDTVKFRMVNQSTGTVKVNDAAATIVSEGDTDTPAEVRYDWAANDVDTAGTYTAWFIRVNATQTEHFPAQDLTGVGVLFEIVFKAVS